MRSNINQRRAWLSAVENLPIVAHLDAIATAVRDNPITVLEAPPGSGKTTILPLYLAQRSEFVGKKVLVLQPRRLAAKSVALRMAELLDDTVGGVVGYHMRLERRASKRTQVEVLTEGLLTRRIISDPELRDVAAVIFDEFHERSVHADTGLALMREVLSVLRPDIKIIVMSATLGDLSEHPFFANARKYTVTLQPHPLAIRYVQPEPRQPLWRQVATIIKIALREHSGDLLAFLPGRYEIERCAEILRGSGNYQNFRNLDILPLYGELPYQEQRRAIAPAVVDRRKIVLATTLAETSITIEGVRIVVDSGYHKISRSSSRGAGELRQERISRDSADQRAGRAARTAPGVCIRLWSQQEHFALRATREPEILRSDITTTLLQLATWGVRDLESFSWLTPPPPQSVRSAIDTLTRIGAIAADGTVTCVGRRIAELGTHPRLGALCLAAKRLGHAETAASLVTMLEEREATRAHANGADIRPRHATLFSGKEPSERLRDLKRAWQERISRLVEEADTATRVADEDALGFLAAVAFPEHIARRRAEDGSRYLLANGSGATLSPGDSLRSAEFLVVTELQDRKDDSLIYAATPLNPNLFEGPLKHLVTTTVRRQFDSERGSLTSYALDAVGAVVLKERPQMAISAEAKRGALRDFLTTQEGFERLSFPESFPSLQSRCAWARSIDPHASLPDISTERLRATLDDWLSPLLPEDGRLTSVTTTLLQAALLTVLPWRTLQLLDQEAPESISLPNGKTRRITYHPSDGPILEAMIQELFTLENTPLLGSRRHPVTLHLLSPARRPMQVTSDLRSFWKNGYPLVRKELRGRYPKHKWPEDPIRGV
jgi:ATP-dependent helicase HrpB